MNKNVTIQDIAEAANVGKGTVDRVLHNRGYVSENTRKRVLQCIDELGYKPNVAARALAKNKTFKIAVIYHDYPSEFWNQIARGISRAKSEYSGLGIIIDQYKLERFDIEKQLTLIQQTVRDGYHGLVIVPYHSEKIVNAINDAVQKGIYVVTMNNDEKCKRHCYIGQDMYKSGETAGRLVSMTAPPNSEYLAIVPKQGVSMYMLDERYQGFLASVQRYRRDLIRREMLLEAGEDINENAVIERIHGVLTNTDIKTVFVSYGITHIVAKAVQMLKTNQKVFLIGYDLTDSLIPFMKNDTVQAVIGQEPERQGYESVSRICRRLLFDEDLNLDTHTKIEIILAENMEESNLH